MVEMQKPLHKTFLVSLCLINALLSANAWAQADDAELGAVLGREIGKYLGSIHYMHAFKASECGHLMRVRPPDADVILRTEILPVFPQSRANELHGLAAQVKESTSTRYANDVASLSKAMAQSKVNPELRCAYMFGMFAGMLTAQEASWHNVRRLASRAKP